MVPASVPPARALDRESVIAELNDVSTLPEGVRASMVSGEEKLWPATVLPACCTKCRQSLPPELEGPSLSRMTTRSVAWMPRTASRRIAQGHVVALIPFAGPPVVQSGGRRWWPRSDRAQEGERAAAGHIIGLGIGRAVAGLVMDRHRQRGRPNPASPWRTAGRIGLASSSTKTVLVANCTVGWMKLWTWAKLPPLSWTVTVTV